MVLWLCQPVPMPSMKSLNAMHWWAPLGGLAGAFAVIMGLLFVDKIGAGPFAGLTITANILMSLVIDHFGLFGIAQHSLNIWRILGGALMTSGIVLVALF
jgi:transporter family-2 protein